MTRKMFKELLHKLRFPNLHWFKEEEVNKYINNGYAVIKRRDDEYNSNVQFTVWKEGDKYFISEDRGELGLLTNTICNSFNTKDYRLAFDNTDYKISYWAYLANEIISEDARSKYFCGYETVSPKKIKYIY